MKKSNSILQSWVTDLGLRHQGVLLAAVRGCDGRDKEAPEKPLIRELRGLILIPFDERELNNPLGFMVKFPHVPAEIMFHRLCRNLDPLPVHYLMHLIHAVEIIGYCHPKYEIKSVYKSRYITLCNKLHINPETYRQMNLRLNEDRIESDRLKIESLKL
jgi:hypothetical protein